MGAGSSSDIEEAKNFLTNIDDCKKNIEDFNANFLDVIYADHLNNLSLLSELSIKLPYIILKEEEEIINAYEKGKEGKSIQVKEDISTEINEFRQVEKKLTEQINVLIKKNVDRMKKLDEARIAVNDIRAVMDGMLSDLIFISRSQIDISKVVQNVIKDMPKSEKKDKNKYEMINMKTHTAEEFSDNLDLQKKNLEVLQTHFVTHMSDYIISCRSKLKTNRRTIDTLHAKVNEKLNKEYEKQKKEAELSKLEVMEKTGELGKHIDESVASLKSNTQKYINTHEKLSDILTVIEKDVSDRSFDANQVEKAFKEATGFELKKK